MMKWAAIFGTLAALVLAYSFVGKTDQDVFEADRKANCFRAYHRDCAMRQK